MSRNLLFILSDEHQARALSCAGHPVVHTPNLDALAARGTRFTQAYTTSPICVPARASLATGRYAFETGYWDNAMGYDGRVAGWAHALSEHGIRCESIGKLHFRSAQDPTGFARQHHAMHLHEGVGQVWGSVRDPLPQLQGHEPMLRPFGAGTSKYNEFDLRCTAAAQEWIERAGAEGSAPWCLFVGLVAPHFPLIVPQAYLDRYPTERMPMPKLRPADGYRQHPWIAAQDAFISNDAEFGSDAERQLAIACYYGLCSFMDEQVGRILDTLRRCGLEASTSVIYSSDHGDNLGARGRWGKSNLYAESSAIPLIVAGPEVAQGVVRNDPASLVDIPTTILGHFGVPHALPHGRDLREGTPATPDRHVFGEYHAVMAPSAAYMLTDGRLKYHEYVGFPPELFDLAEDPEETTDLAASRPQDVRAMAELLRELVDPLETDRRAKADQAALVERFGGRAAALRLGAAGATPIPST